MKYYLSSNQWTNLWYTVINDEQWADPQYDMSIEYENRKSLWTTRYAHLNIIYYENSDEYEEGYYGEGYYGVLSGDEKYINWLLLQI